MIYVPLLCHIKYDRQHASKIPDVTRTTEEFADCVALAFDTDGHFEYIVHNGGRIPDHRVRGVWPARKR